MCTEPRGSTTRPRNKLMASAKQADFLRRPTTTTITPAMSIRLSLTPQWQRHPLVSDQPLSVLTRTLVFESLTTGTGRRKVPATTEQTSPGP